jgi:hypothetical protein
MASTLCPATADAQTVARSFAELRPLVKPGETVRVTEATGQEAEGQIIELSSSLVLQLPTGRRELAEPDVSKVRRWTGRRGSPLGAVIGAAAGAVAGSLIALGVAFQQCGGSCSDEKFLMGLSIIGIPVAGGFLGYYLPGGNRTLTTIYDRPSASTVTVLPIVTGRQKGVLVSVHF